MCAKEIDLLGVFSFNLLYDAYRHSRKGKRNAINAMCFETDLIGNFAGLQNQLMEGSYQPSRSACINTNNAKLREIVAADFSDRVVHHYLVPRLQKFTRTIQQAEAIGRWYLQLDIRSFL